MKSLLLTPTPEMVDMLDANITELRERGNATASASPTHAFQLGTALVSHTRPDYIAEGVELIELLAFQLWRERRKGADSLSGDAAARRGADVETLTDCYYYLSIGHAKLEDWGKASTSVEQMLELHPAHPQGQALKQHIDHEAWVRGVKGLSAVATAAGVVLGFAALLSKARR
jgi:hypothetical protein